MDNPTFTINLETKEIEFNINGGVRGLKGDTGDTGATGPAGADGYTPVKGVDYFTQEDIASLNIPTKTSDLTNDSLVDISNAQTITGTKTFSTKTNFSNGIDTNGDVRHYYCSKFEVDDSNDYGVMIFDENVDDILHIGKETTFIDPVNNSNPATKKYVDDSLNSYATNTALGTEITNRENADIGLQGQIDAITSSSDVKDIVGTYTDLQNYDTSTLGNDDIIKVLQDSTHNDAMTYYRWVITGGVGAWSYIGQEGPYYTKSEIDTTLLPYVKNTDYATSSVGGVIKSANGFLVANDGIVSASYRDYAGYVNADNRIFIGKGTLENVITGKDLTTKAYVDGLIGDINTALDTINGEVI